MLQQSLNVTREHIDLKVDSLARLGLPEGRNRLSMRDNVHAEPVAFDLIHREGDAVDGDRALGGDETREFGRRLHRQPNAAAVLPPT